MQVAPSLSKVTRKRIPNMSRMLICAAKGIPLFFFFYTIFSWQLPLSTGHAGDKNGCFCETASPGPCIIYGFWRGVLAQSKMRVRLGSRKGPAIPFLTHVSCPTPVIVPEPEWMWFDKIHPFIWHFLSSYCRPGTICVLGYSGQQSLLHRASFW